MPSRRLRYLVTLPRIFGTIAIMVFAKNERLDPQV